MDPHIKSIMKTPGNYGSIPFLDTKSLPNPDSIMSTSVFWKPIHTNHYLDWNSNLPISAKKVFIQALTYRAKNVCSTSQFFAKEMDYLHRVLLKRATQIGSSKIQKRI